MSIGAWLVKGLPLMAYYMAESIMIGISGGASQEDLAAS